MQLVRANPELLPTLLAAFDDFDARIAGLVARRTGRAEADPFCRLTALIAAGTLRTALAIAPRWGTDDAPFDPDVLTPSFDALRALTTPAADH
jgi:hypothetical protein